MSLDLCPPETKCIRLYLEIEALLPKCETPEALLLTIKAGGAAKRLAIAVGRTFCRFLQLANDLIRTCCVVVRKSIALDWMDGWMDEGMEGMNNQTHASTD